MTDETSSAERKPYNLLSKGVHLHIKADTVNNNTRIIDLNQGIHGKLSEKHNSLKRDGKGKICIGCVDEMAWL